MDVEAMSGGGPDGPFVPVSREDVSDLAGLPRRFDRFAEEVRTSFDMLGAQILPAINRIEQGLADLRLEMRSELNDLHRRVSALEAAPRPRKKSPVKKRR